jgi:hypothetical protein
MISGEIRDEVPGLSGVVMAHKNGTIKLPDVLPVRPSAA